MKGKYITDNTEVKNKGDYSTFSRKDGTYGIIYCCPICGEVSAGTGNHVFFEDAQSVTPSIVHKCGWHGHLKNGVFITIP